MISFVQGNLFEDTAGALVIPVNCVGTMGKGVALECKKRHPRVYKHYRSLCDEERIVPGDAVYFGTTVRAFFLVATKDHWRDGSRLEWITHGLSNLNAKVHARGIRSIALPALGCGAGGLAWRDVKPAIEHYMNIEGVDTRVYEPVEEQ